MKHSTLLLRIVIIAFSLLVLALCLYILLALIFSNGSGSYSYILGGMLIPAVPFFIGIWHTLKILSYIDHDNVFTNDAVNSLKYIQYCGLCISVLYGIGMPYIFVVADRDDAPGVVLLGLIFTFAPLIIASLALIFRHALKHAINIKLENENTV